MRFPRRGAALLTSFAVLTLPLTGCHHDNTGGSGVPVVAKLNADDQVATVNQQAVTQSEFFAQLQNYAPNPQSPTAAMPAGRAVLQQMIQGLCYIGLAQQEGVAPTDAEVDAQYDNLKLVQDSANIKTFEERLAENGLTMQDVKEIQIRPQLAQIKLLTKGNPAPTAAQIQAYYDQHKADQFTKPDRAHVRGIALASQSDATSIYQQIQGGKKFDDFVDRSLNKSLPKGEFLQWVPLDASKNPALEPLIDGIKTTAIGKTTAPFQFQNAWWLIQVEDKKSQETVPFDQIKGLIPFALMEQAALPQQADSKAVREQKEQKFKDVQQQEQGYQKKLANSNGIKIDLPGTQYVTMLDDMKNPPVAPPMGLTPTPPPGPAPTAPARPAAPAKH
jgi:parvulin-like peptidyl-prolyl isomerase